MTQVVDKSGDDGALTGASISRVCYLSNEGTALEHEVMLPANRQVLHDLAVADAVVYACGSLYTSICPSLVLLGVGETIADRNFVIEKKGGAKVRVPKILLLNGSHDRETAACVSHAQPMKAVRCYLAST